MVFILLILEFRDVDSIMAYTGFDLLWDDSMVVFQNEPFDVVRP